MRKSVNQLPSPKKIWRIWLGSQSPRRPILRWSSTDKLVLLIVCLLVAIFSSYKLLAVPDLKPGDIAPFNEIAPKDALVIDNQALKEKKKVLQGSFVQVIDKNQSDNLEADIVKKMTQLRTLKDPILDLGINKINLTNLEKNWLIGASNREWELLKKEIKIASKKMLSQGIIDTLDLEQLVEASSLQLVDLGIKDSPSRSLGAKILSSTFYQKTNLKVDTLKTNILHKSLINQEDLSTIRVKEGSIITRKGKPISPQEFDILEHFNKVSRSPRPL